MLSWIRRLFGSQEATSRGSADGSRSVNIASDAFYHANSDILDGMEFFATLQVRTPLWILEHHGEVFRGPPSQAPDYGGMANGIWLPRTCGELSDFLPEGRTAASDVGHVAAEEYLPFLKAFRLIVEGADDEVEKLRQLRQLPKLSPPFARFWAKLKQYYPDFPESFFFMRLAELEGVGPTTAKRLYEGGFRSVEDVRAASDADLLAVKGVGKAMVAKIRRSTP